MSNSIFAVFVLAPYTKQYNRKSTKGALEVAGIVFPVRIKWRDPIGLGGANNAGSCRGDDGYDYVLKDSSVHPLTPHNEWFCTKLADILGIACPPCTTIEEDDGNTLFGSRWEGGVSPDDCWEIIGRGDIPTDSAFASLSRILAFDHFIHNKDRSTSNYIIRASLNSHVIMAIDLTMLGYVMVFLCQIRRFHRNLTQDFL